MDLRSKVSERDLLKSARVLGMRNKTQHTCITPAAGAVS